MQSQLKSWRLMLCRFNTEHGKPRKRFINIAKMLEQQKVSKQLNSLQPTISNSFTSTQDPYLMFKSFSSPSQQQPAQVHLTPQQQQINHRIKTAIRSESLYHECTKNKHKLQPRHYALMFCKLLELRKSVPKERNQTQILEQKLEKMPPQQLVRLVFAMKNQSVNKNQLKLFMPVIQKIINEFSNQSNSELEPKSFETLKFSTNIKLFHSFLFLLENTGSHFEVKLKHIMNETLNYVLFRAMKTKKHTKTGEYLNVGLKMSFLASCNDIEASPACIRNLVLSVLVEKDKLQLGTLLQLENAVFRSPEVLERTRRQLFIEKDIHLKYNILNRIEHYIQEKIPSNLKKSSDYSLLTRKLVRHLQCISEFSFEELNLMQINSHKDEQIFKILTLFHQGYKNCLIENFASINEKEQAIQFFRKSQQQQYTLYELLKFFYLKMKNQGANAIRPSIKKELKDFVGLLTKFYGKLNFLTQSILIELLVMSNFTNIKSVMIEYLHINTFATSQRKAAERPHFFVKEKHRMIDKFFEMINYSTSFRENCPVQYEVFMKSNLKPLLKHIFKSNEQINIEKYAFYLAAYCKTLSQSETKSLIDEVVNMYVKQSWSNRAFRKDQVEVIYKNKEYFLASRVQQVETEMENQTDIFGENLLKKQQALSHQNESLLSTLENDREVMREFYGLEHQIRQKLRNLLRNFKLVVLFLQNLKLSQPKEISSTLITEELYHNLLTNFKTETECMKFERLFTKQNCSEIMEIHEFLKDVWGKTLSSVQVRNEFLIHHNENTKEKVSQTAAKTMEDALNKKNEDKKQDLQGKKPEEELIDEEEEESDEGQYTQEIERLEGKDLLSLETLKVYNEKQTKNLQFFKLKNKDCLIEIKKLTKDFTQLPKDMQILKPQFETLKLLSNHYALDNQDSNTESNFKVINLAILDETKIRNENFNGVLTIQVQNNQNRVIYSFKVYQKQYPTFEHISLGNKTQGLPNNDNLLEQVYYVASNKLRRNKKRIEEINQINSKKEDASKEDLANKKLQRLKSKQGKSLNASQESS